MVYKIKLRFDKLDQFQLSQFECKTVIVVLCVVVMEVRRHLLTTIQTSASRHMLLLHSSISESCSTFVRMTTWSVFDCAAHRCAQSCKNVLQLMRHASL